MDEGINEKIQEINLILNDHKNKLEILERRADEQDKECLTLNELVLSVREMAVNMTYMLDEQKKFNNRLQKMEEKPAATMNLITSTIITAIIAGIIGYLLKGLL